MFYIKKALNEHILSFQTWNSIIIIIILLGKVIRWKISIARVFYWATDFIVNVFPSQITLSSAIFNGSKCISILTKK